MENLAVLSESLFVQPIIRLKAFSVLFSKGKSTKMMLAFLGCKGDVNGLAGIQGGKKSIKTHTHFQVQCQVCEWVLDAAGFE